MTEPIVENELFEGRAPIGLGLHGVHHTARATWRLSETVTFYRDIMGLELCHAISARGWGPEDHPDFIHFFFRSGDGSTIAFFYYLSTDDPDPTVDRSSWLYRSTHTAWSVSTQEDLAAWRARFETHGYDVMQVQHELIESIYVTDPNGYPVELTWESRPMDRLDGRDASLTIEAAMRHEAQAGTRALSIEDVWRSKGELLTKELGMEAVTDPTVFVPDLPEFASLVPSLQRLNPGCMIREHAGYTTVTVGGKLQANRRDAALRPALWYTAFSGGVIGRVVTLDREDAQIVPAEENRT